MEYTDKYDYTDENSMIIICDEVHIHKNGVIGGICSPLTEGGGSLNAIQII